jgi:O-antigen ligase
MVVLFLPYVVLLRSKANGFKWLYNLLILFFVICIYFSFTRAAILCIFIGVGSYFIIKKAWIEKTLVLASTVVILGLGYLSFNNNYLKLAPNFEKTITHNKFDNLIEATYKMEDISTMERLYRWVAGFEMVKDRPLSGFGPNNFYLNYSKYTISAFQTYVSDNPDQSGIHNYYLMTTVDQGIPGLLIFLALIFISLIIGQKVYHALTKKSDKHILMAALTSLIIILSLNLINDMIETDKVGPFFFTSMCIIAFYYYKVKTEQDEIAA